LQAAELTLGRSFGVAFDDGEDFFDALAEFCRVNGVRQGFIPMFIAGLREVDLVGTCEKVDDPEAPVWSSVRLENVEAVGGGTLASDTETGEVVPHLHLSVGLKHRSAGAFTSHLLGAKVEFLTEMYLVEVSEPTMSRVRQADLYNVPRLLF
jgi:predicted DNA-binding protein with PD1-like motif